MTPKEKYLKFIESVRPQVSFSDDDQPEAPNYLDDDYWAALPGRDGFHLLSPDHPPSSELKIMMFFIFIPPAIFKLIGMLH